MNLEGEAWLAKRLGIDGVLGADALFSGATDTNTRRERIRAAILKRGPDVVCDVRAGAQTTYREAFEVLYGQSLQQRENQHGEETRQDSAARREDVPARQD